MVEGLREIENGGRVQKETSKRKLEDRKGKRGWPRLPWRPYEPNGPTRGCRGMPGSSVQRRKEGKRVKRERTLSSLLPPSAGEGLVSPFSLFVYPSSTPSPLLSARARAPPPMEAHSQRNYAKSSTRKIRDTTSRRVPTSTCCIAISREISGWRTFPRRFCVYLALSATVSIQIDSQGRRGGGNVFIRLRRGRLDRYLATLLQRSLRCLKTGG